MTLSPWMLLLDVSEKGGTPDGFIGNGDIDAFLDNPDIPINIKQATRTVFGIGSGTSNYALVGPAGAPSLLVKAPTSITPLAAPPAAPILTTATRASAFTPPPARVTIVTVTASTLVGWKVGGALDDRWDAVTPTALTLRNPDNGNITTVPLYVLRQYPDTQSATVINAIVAGHTLPIPQNRSIIGAPKTYINDNDELITTDIPPKLIDPLDDLARFWGVTKEQIVDCMANWNTNPEICRGLPEGLLAQIFGFAGNQQCISNFSLQNAKTTIRNAKNAGQFTYPTTETISNLTSVDPKFANTSIADLTSNQIGEVGELRRAQQLDAAGESFARGSMVEVTLKDGTTFRFVPDFLVPVGEVNNGLLRLRYDEVKAKRNANPHLGNLTTCQNMFISASLTGQVDSVRAIGTAIKALMENERATSIDIVDFGIYRKKIKE